jgi:branched-chain amino acid transport system permease protein
LQQWLQNLGAWYLIIFGSVAVIIALWLPKGIWGAIREKTNFELLPVGYRVKTRAAPTSTSVEKGEIVD